MSESNEISETCGFCNKATITTEPERQMQACQACATTIGLIPMPPVRRPPHPCGRCNARRFMRVIPREHSSARMGEYNRQLSVPMFVTTNPRRVEGWFSSSVEQLAIETDGVGLLEMYICTQCGFVEWYCVDFENLRAHPHTMTEIVDYTAGPQGTYR